MLSHSLAPETLSLGGEGMGGPKSDEGTDTLVLYVYYNPSTGAGFCKDIHYEHFTGVKGGGGTNGRKTRKEERKPSKRGEGD